MQIPACPEQDCSIEHAQQGALDGVHETARHKKITSTHSGIAGVCAHEHCHQGLALGSHFPCDKMGIQDAEVNRQSPLRQAQWNIGCKKATPCTASEHTTLSQHSTTCRKQMHEGCRDAHQALQHNSHAAKKSGSRLAAALHLVCAHSSLISFLSMYRLPATCSTDCAG